MRKRIVSLVLSLVLILNLVPISVWAEELSDSTSVMTETTQTDTSASEGEVTTPSTTESSESTDPSMTPELTTPSEETKNTASPESTTPPQETEASDNSEATDTPEPTEPTEPTEDSGAVDSTDSTGPTDPAATPDTTDTSSETESTESPGTTDTPTTSDTASETTTPTPITPESDTTTSDTDTGSSTTAVEAFMEGEGWEYYSATRLYGENQPMLFYAPSTTTVGINISNMNGYTNTATGQKMSWHFINDGGYIQVAWCIQPSATVINGESYALDSVLSNQTLMDVLQIAYEWGYWSNSASFNAQYIAATQVAVWWALGYSSAACSNSTVNSLASSLYSAAQSDYGCGGGGLYAYECTTNSAHQRLATYYPYRNVTTQYGDIQIKKTSANPTLTNGNSCYSLQGAVYGIYSSRSNATNDRNRLGTLTTNANGVTGYSVDLEAGYNYYVKEITAPKGYALDSTVYTVSVSANNTSVLNVVDTPQSDPVGVLLKKVDATTGKGETCS